MNWKTEAMEKLKRYEAMRKSVENIPEELCRLELAATGIRSTAEMHPCLLRNRGPINNENNGENQDAFYGCPDFCSCGAIPPKNMGFRWKEL